MEERPWLDFRKGKSISVRQLANLLKPFEIFAAGTIRLGEETAKGYKKSAFYDSWTRYLPNLSVTTSQTTVDAGSSPIGNVTTNSDVTDENRPQASIDAGCDLVTAKNGELHRQRV